MFGIRQLFRTHSSGICKVNLMHETWQSHSRDYVSHRIINLKLANTVVNTPISNLYNPDIPRTEPLKTKRLFFTDNRTPDTGSFLARASRGHGQSIEKFESKMLTSNCSVKCTTVGRFLQFINFVFRIQGTVTCYSVF